MTDRVDLVTRMEKHRLWSIRALIPKSRRKRDCEARGEHRPVNLDGMRKLCLNCGTW